MSTKILLWCVVLLVFLLLWMRRQTRSETMVAYSPCMDQRGNTGFVGDDHACYRGSDLAGFTNCAYDQRLDKNNPYAWWCQFGNYNNIAVRSQPEPQSTATLITNGVFSATDSAPVMVQFPDQPSNQWLTLRPVTNSSPDFPPSLSWPWDNQMATSDDVVYDVDVQGMSGAIE